MSNMSYCRFQNTASDLADCAGALEELCCDELIASPLSREELAAAKRLVQSCANIIELLSAELDEERENSYDGTLERINKRVIEAQGRAE